MNFSTFPEDEDEDDEKVIPKTASSGRGQKINAHVRLFSNPEYITVVTSDSAISKSYRQCVKT